MIESSFVKNMRLIVILTFIISCQACDYSCLTRSYSLNNNFVTFKAKQISGINYLTIDLVGYNVNLNYDLTIGVSIISGNSATKFLCDKDTIGNIAASVINKHVSFPDGSSMYRDNTMYCSWTFTKTDRIWPLDQYSDIINFESESDYQINLISDSTSYLVASNTQDLPIYQLKFLKCCYKVHGNEDFQVFIQQTESSNDFTLQMMKPSTVVQYNQVVLTKSDGSQLQFVCYLKGEDMTTYAQINGHSGWSFTDSISDEAVDPSGICSWSFPLTIHSTIDDTTFETRNGVFDLKIYQEETPVYIEHNVNLKSAASYIYSKLFILFCTFFTIQMFNYTTKF